MTREQTQQLKGIAILFMIWGHLFGAPEHVLEAYCPLVLLGDLPLVSWLSRAMGPVSFFLLLSGYGLYCANQKGDKHRYSRIVRLLLTYWLILIITIVVGNLVEVGRYPLSLSEVILNVTGLHPTYIPEAWFLPPYILLALTAPWEFRLLSNVKSRYILPFAFVLNLGTSFLLSRYGSTHIYPHRVFYMLFCWFHFQFSFLTGMVMARCKMFADLYTQSKIFHHVLAPKIYSNQVLPIMLLLLIIVRCMTSSSAIHAIYVALFVMIWVRMEIPNCVNRLLTEFGNSSTGMWFVHTTLGLYLFPQWFNWLQNPMLVFAGVVVVSWMVARVVQGVIR